MKEERMTKEINELIDTFISEIHLMEEVLSETNIPAQRLQEEIERIQRASIIEQDQIPQFVDDMARIPYTKDH